jgi:hypothetical protein
MILGNNIASMIFSNKKLTDFLLPDPDPWHGTFLQGYVDKNNKVKGKFGEMLVEALMSLYGHSVFKPINKGHDRIITSNVVELTNTIKKVTKEFKVEIKFGVAHRNPKNKGTVLPGVFSFNHFGIQKDWERAIIISVDPGPNIYAVWFDKQDLITNIASENPIFSRQQGGKNGNNDDWMFITNPTSWQNFINLSWVKSLGQW